MAAQRVRPAYEGWNTEAAPDYLSEAQAPLVENLLCRTGKLVMRGPIRDTLALEQTAADTKLLGVPRGALVYQNQVYLGLQVGSDASDGYGAHVQIETVGLTVAGSEQAVALVPRGRSAQISSAAYGRSYGGGFLKWAGVGLPSLYTEPNAPFGFADIANHAERLFIGGGTVNGTGSPATLLYSVPGGPAANTVADWTDSVSGLVNQIKVGDDSDPIVALGRVGRELAIFKRASIWLLSGTGSSSFTVRQLTDTLGCSSAMSVVSLDEGCYFLSDRGYHWLDGGVINEISRDIAPTVRAAIRDSVELQYGPTSRTAGQIGFQDATYLPGGGILLTLGVFTVSPGGSNPITVSIRFQAIYDVRARRWVKYSSKIHDYPTNSASGIIAGYRLGDRSIGFDGWSAFLLDEVMNPEAALTGQGGIDVRAAGLNTAVVPTATTAIPAKWWSRLIRLASPISAAQLHRLLFDYRMDLGADTPGWYVSLRRGDGTTAVAEYQVPGEAAGAPTYVSRRRASKEAFGEAVDVQLRVEWRGSTAAMTLAEIYDATIEFAAARDRDAA